MTRKYLTLCGNSLWSKAHSHGRIVLGTSHSPEQFDHKSAPPHPRILLCIWVGSYTGRVLHCMNEGKPDEGIIKIMLISKTSLNILCNHL